MTSMAGAIVSGGVRAGAAVVGGAASAVGGAASAAGSVAGSMDDQASQSIEYFVDTLFRGEPGGNGEDASQELSEQAAEIAEIPAGEVMRIFTRALRNGTLAEEDERYVGQLITEHTDLNQQEAQQRVTEAFGEVQRTLDEAETAAREATEAAREASAYAALWIFIALLIGAFTASLLAVFGGRQRDA